MEKLQDLFRNRLSIRKINKTIAVYMILKYLSSQFNTNLKWILKNDILYIKSSNPHINFEIFIKKKDILNQINSKLQQYGYSLKIKDIRKSK